MTPRDAAELEGIIDQRERAVRELEARLDTARVLLAVAVAQRPTETGGVAEEQNRRLGDALVRRPTETTRRESRDG